MDMAIRPWSSDDDAILTTRYPSEGMSSKSLQEKLGRKQTTLWRRAKVLGLKRLKPEYHPLFTGYNEVSGSYIAAVRNGAKHRCLMFALTAREVYDCLVRQGFRCVYSNRLISFKDRSASVDRIDASRGYTIDNIQIVHIDVNMMKMARSHEAFLALVHQLNSWRLER